MGRALLFGIVGIASTLPLAAGDGRGAGGIVEVAGIDDLVCVCVEDPPLAALLEWRLAGTAERIVVRIGELEPPVELPGDARRFLVPPELLEAQPPGRVRIEVAAAVGNQLGRRAECAVDCPFDLERSPQAAVDPALTPLRVCVPPESPVVVELDGRSSVDADGGRELEYFWFAPTAPDGLELVEVLEPRSVVTRVRLQPLPRGELERDVIVRLRVRSRASGERPSGDSVVEHTIVIVAEDPVLGQPPRLNRVHPRNLTVVANTPRSLQDGTGRRGLDFFLTLAAGCQDARFELLDGPPGLELDPVTGRVRWLPSSPQAGREHDVTVRVVNAEGLEEVRSFVVRVVDAAVPPLLLDVPPPSGEPGVDSPPPRVYPDGTAASLPSPLHLILPPEAERCAVVLRVDDRGADGVTALRFQPRCDPADRDGDGGGAGGSTYGGYYVTGTAAQTISKNVTDEFTIELWVSGVDPAQAGASGGRPAYIFSMSQGTTDVNWLIGTTGDNGAGEQTFVFETQLAGEATPRVHTIDADLSDTTPHQLVFVKDREEHRLYVDGVEVGSAAGLPTDVDWDDSFQVHLGAASGGLLPYTGSYHGAAVYGEALSPAMVELLAGIGPTVPAPGDVEAPLVGICPDPQEISRVRGFELDGTITVAGVGDGGGAAATCDEWLEFLRPAEWSVHDAAGPITAATVVPASGFGLCLGKAEIDFPSAASDLYEVRLRVRQIAVRGIEKEGTSTPGVFLSTELVRGDSNCDGLVDISDAVFALQFLFDSGGPPCCLDSADGNDDGALDVSDPQYVLSWLFSGGAPPPSPGVSSCGPDTTRETGRSFVCESYTACP